MRKSFLLKLLMLALCAAMMLSLFACTGGEVETEPESNGQEEVPTDPEGGDDTDPEGGDETNPGGSDETNPGGGDETIPKPECDGNHEIEAKGDQGHYTVGCEICGTENSKPEPHTYAIVEGKPTCTVCGHVAECGGVHTYTSNAENHWIAACNSCGYAGVAEEAHTFEAVEGKYVCTVCEYEPTCPNDGTHELVSDGETGHHEAACLYCGTAAGATVAHTFELVEGKPTCACGYEAACGGDHNWQSDAEGHWADACTVCGAAALEKSAHDTFTESVVEGAYVYGCATCGYAAYTKTLTDKVAAIIVPGNVNKNEASADKGNLNISTKFQAATAINTADDGMTFVSITGTSTVSQMIWNRHLGDVADRSEFEEYTFDIGQAKYLVIKARATMAAESNITLEFSTAGFEGKAGVMLPLVKATENAEWVTYVINLEKAFGEKFAKAEGADTYVVDTFYFHMQPFTTTDVLDIAYMAFVEGEWADVAANVEEETVVSVTASNVGTVVNTADATCVGAHNYAAEIADGVYKSVCACGASKDSYGVKADGPDAFWAAENIYGMVVFTGTADKEVRYDEDETAYIRFSNTKVNKDNWSAFQWTNSGSVATGQYMIMKFRIGENGLGQSTLQMYINSKGSEAAGNNWTKGEVSVKVSEDGQWHYLVIDLASRVATGGFMASEDGSYSVNYFSVRYFTGKQTVTEADDYMDVSYIAFCDDLAQLKDIVDAEAYEWSIDKSTNAVLKTEDNTCVSHAYGEVIDGNTHTVKCATCGHIARTFTIDESINWYSDLSAMNCFNGTTLNKVQVDPETGIVYNDFNASAATHWNFTGGGGAGAFTSAKYQTGEYLVIKYRAGSDKDSGLNMYIGTGDKGVTNTSASNIGTFTAKAGEGWKVAIVKINDPVDAKDNYTIKDEQTLYFMGMPQGDRQLDIAFVAVVDSIDEMKTLLDEGETYLDYGTSFSNTPVEYYQDGTKVPCKTCSFPSAATVTDGENGAKVYTYACVACGKAMFTKTVPAGVTYFAPEVISTTTAATVVNPNEENANSPEVYAEKSGLNPGTHFGMTSKLYTCDSDANYLPYFGFKGNDASHKTGQFIWNRSYEDYTTNAPGYGRYIMDMGQSRFLVLKVRTSLAHTEADAFTIKISTKGAKAASIKLPVQATQGDWVTYVIDLESVIASNWVKDAETGTYLVDSFYLDFYTFLTTDSVDIAYLAFVEGDWTAVDAFVDEENVINLVGADRDWREYTAGGQQVSYSVPEVNAAEEGTTVKVTGTVSKINTAYNSDYDNITLTITDDAGNSLYVYRLTGNFELGDIITITGNKAIYNGAVQIAQGATAVKVGTHTTHNYADATCTAPATCIVCGATDGEAAGHVDEAGDGFCDVCGENPNLKTEELEIAASTGTLAEDALSITWAAESFTVIGEKGSSSNAIRTSDADHFRAYAKSNLKIAGNGITEIVFTATSADYATVLAGSLTTEGATAVADGATVTVTVTEGTLDEIAFTMTAQTRISKVVVSYIATEE